METHLRSTLELAARDLPHPTVGKVSNPIHKWLVSGEIHISEEAIQWMQQKWWGGMCDENDLLMLLADLPIRESARVLCVVSSSPIG